MVFTVITCKKGGEGTNGRLKLILLNSEKDLDFAGDLAETIQPFVFGALASFFFHCRHCSFIEVFFPCVFNVVLFYIFVP